MGRLQVEKIALLIRLMNLGVFGGKGCSYEGIASNYNSGQWTAPFSLAGKAVSIWGRMDHTSWSGFISLSLLPPPKNTKGYLLFNARALNCDKVYVGKSLLTTPCLYDIDSSQHVHQPYSNGSNYLSRSIRVPAREMVRPSSRASKTCKTLCAIRTGC